MSICKPKITFIYWFFLLLFKLSEFSRLKLNSKGKTTLFDAKNQIFFSSCKNSSLHTHFFKLRIWLIFFPKYLESTKLLRRWFMSFYSANCVSPFAAACYCCSPGSQFYFYGLPFSVLHCNTASEQCFFENMIKSQTYQEFWRNHDHLLKWPYQRKIWLLTLRATVPKIKKGHITKK